VLLFHLFFDYHAGMEIRKRAGEVGQGDNICSGPIDYSVISYFAVEEGLGSPEKRKMNTK
jgi:hypothetical protein